MKFKRWINDQNVAKVWASLTCTRQGRRGPASQVWFGTCSLSNWLITDMEKQIHTNIISTSSGRLKLMWGLSAGEFMKEGKLCFEAVFLLREHKTKQKQTVRSVLIIPKVVLLVLLKSFFSRFNHSFWYWWFIFAELHPEPYFAKLSLHGLMFSNYCWRWSRCNSYMHASFSVARCLRGLSTHGACINRVSNALLGVRIC